MINWCVFMLPSRFNVCFHNTILLIYISFFFLQQTITFPANWEAGKDVWPGLGSHLEPRYADPMEERSYQLDQPGKLDNYTRT